MMHWQRIVNGASDLAFSKIRHQHVALRTTYHIKMIDVLRISAFLGHGNW